MSADVWIASVVGLCVVFDLVAATRLAQRIAPRACRGTGGVVRGPLALTFRSMIGLYRAAWSVRSVGVCRFEPSCSAYGLEAVRRYGGVRGGLLTARRLLRCQPLSAGGYDPVPVRNGPRMRDHGLLRVSAGARKSRRAPASRHGTRV